MRLLLAVLIQLLPLNLAVAVNLGPTADPKPAPGDPYAGGGRVGGDTVLDATVIPSIPFADTGNTCGYANDYDEACPYTTSTAPDVVYVYTEVYDQVVRVDLCASGYDTKVYVWMDEIGNVVACNDDAGCGVDGYRSRIDNLYLAGGHTYYFVVDGYGAACGSYDLAIVTIPPCVVECPPGAQLEGEPPCVDGYVDVYNTGCDGGFTTIEPQDGSAGVMCGRACTFLSPEGYEARDTDWYTAVAEGGPVTLVGRAEFPLQLLLIYGIDCSNLEYIYAAGAACDPVTLTWNFAPDQEFWPWAGPSVFTGVAESEYVLELTGIAPSNPLGACCSNSYCHIDTEQRCAAYGTYLGDGTVCVPNPCGTDIGACCLDQGTDCQVVSELECVQVLGGRFVPNLPCFPNPCHEGYPGACCLSDGNCVVVIGPECGELAGNFLGIFTDCDPYPCLQVPGACCYPASQHCVLATAAFCEAEAGVFLGENTDCDPNPCGPEPPGACCYLDGSCQIQSQPVCLWYSGNWYGAGTDCEPNPCPDPTPVERTSWGRLKNAFR